MTKNLNAGTIVRWTLAIIVIGFIAAVFIWNATTPNDDVHENVAWNEAMTMGSPDAEHHFIEYTDAMCPYCSFFTIALHDEYDSFKTDYLDTNKIYFELRLTSATASKNPNSVRANTAGYCAANYDKFWPFFEALQYYMNEKYYSQVDFTSAAAVATFKETEPEFIDDQIYLDLAVEAGIDAGKMSDCMDDGVAEAELARNTSRASATIAGGVPYFVFGKYKSSGFSGDYNTIIKMFKAGGAE